VYVHDTYLVDAMGGCWHRIFTFGGLVERPHVSFLGIIGNSTSKLAHHSLGILEPELEMSSSLGLPSFDFLLVMQCSLRKAQKEEIMAPRPEEQRFHDLEVAFCVFPANMMDDIWCRDKEGIFIEAKTIVSIDYFRDPTSVVVS
jgi:hypothetical protein